MIFVAEVLDLIILKALNSEVYQTAPSSLSFDLVLIRYNDLFFSAPTNG